MPALLLTACAPRPEAPVVEPPLPKMPRAQAPASVQPDSASLAPLATPQQVVRAVDVGRRDPFAAVLTPRLISAPTQQTGGVRPAAAKPLPPLEVPKGLVFQGVLEGPTGQEALVEYVPASGGTAAGVRSGSLRVGDVGSDRPDALLPPGWRVGAIDVARGRLVLQAGSRSLILEL